ncbi:hydroxyethylthiazole kinase [Geminicoccus flavidas]|uniref:hydroxyethylthiazole kinase n=1 Tax=Geminicoccus flavidas TaxID=2506407 RepID=UPI001358DCF0|nr:hydroxyethylthiazole kinase [Geminicoccus flavidas]
MTIPSAAIGRVLDAIRARRPLVHNITNYVVMNTTANALLAVGASPAMVHAEAEVEEFTGIADALVINIGTLSVPWIAAMHLAAAKARTFGKPWVLDPVGAGATRFRTDTAFALLEHRPTLIRGNGSEIVALAGGIGAARGVDSTMGDTASLEAAKALAAATGSVVAVTGPVDRVTNGTAVWSCANGDVRMTRVTGLGCTLSALSAACLAVEPEPVVAALAACAILGAAGEIAAAATEGPGSLQVAILDRLADLDAATLEQRAKLS